MTGVYVGDLSALESLLAAFEGAVGELPFTRYTGVAAYPHTMMVEAGCDADSVAQCHLPSEDPAGVLTRQP